MSSSHSYQHLQKDAGEFAHDDKYMIKVLNDSLADLATKVPVDMSRMIRP